MKTKILMIGIFAIILCNITLAIELNPNEWPGLRLLYRFSNTWDEETDNSTWYLTTDNGTPQLSSIGVFGSSAYFDAEESRYNSNVGQSIAFSNTQNRTYMTWINATSYPYATQNVFFSIKSLPTSANQEIELRFDRDNGEIDILEAGWSDDSCTDDRCNLSRYINKWVHVAVVIDATNKTKLWYINGTNVQNHTMGTVRAPSGADSVVVGKDAIDTADRSMRGHLDDLAIFNRTLSSDEILLISKEYIFQSSSNYFKATFNDSSVEGNLIFNSEVYKWLQIPLLAKNIYGSINLSRVIPGNTESCYQETANVSTLCGGLDTGEYKIFDTSYYNNYSHIMDGDYSTFAYAAGTTIPTLRINYTKPAGTTLAWQVKDALGTFNLTIPNACFVYYTDVIEFQIVSRNSALPYVEWSCKKGSSDYLTLRNSTGYPQAQVFEEAMFWETPIVNNYTLNPYLKIGDIVAWNYTGYFTTSILQEISENIYDSLNDGDCDCTDCVVSDNNCLIPFLFSSETNGTIDYILNVSYDINYSTSFSDYIYTDHQTNYKIYFPRVQTNIPSAKLQINATFYNLTAQIFNSTHFYVTKDVMISETGYNVSYSHQWTLYLDNGKLITDVYNQSLYTVNVSTCDANNPYKIINISYQDEIDDSYINTSLGYDISIFDSQVSNNLVGSFPDNASHYFCTNLNPADVNYTWNLSGDLTASKDNYITKILSINPSTPIEIGNNPTQNLTIKLISISNSSTILYNWYTQGYQAITGTMRIYSCDGATRTLVSSEPVTNGQATSNIILLTQPYSYDITVDGVTYQEDSYYTCHVESQTERTFYVTITDTTVTPDIGMNFISCNLEKSGQIATMSWGINPNDPTAITGCLRAYRSGIYGYTQIYENCSETENPLIRTIPSNSFDYHVRGILQQGDREMYCEQELDFSADKTSTEELGASAILAVILLIMSLALFYAGDGEASIVGAGIGILGAWFLGLMNFNWIYISPMIAFLVIIVIIGRYSRKN